MSQEADLLQEHNLRLRFRALAAAAAAVLTFLLGVAPGYKFEMDGDMHASRYCPAPPGSEASFDQDCAVSIVARGPLYLGKESLALSFLLGVSAIVFLWSAERTRERNRHTKLVIALALYLFAWALLLAWNAAEGDRLVHVGPTILS